MRALADQHALIDAHLDFARKGALRYTRLFHGRIPFEEFLSAAYLGLTMAARDYQEGHNTTFATYAFYCIDGQLRKVYRSEQAARGWADITENGLRRWTRHVRITAWPTDPETGYVVDVAGPTSAAPDDRLWKLLDTLPSDKLKSVVLMRLADMPFRAIGERMHISWQRAHALWNRAMVEFQRTRHRVGYRGSKRISAAGRRERNVGVC